MVGKGRCKKIRQNPDIDIAVHCQMYLQVSSPCAKFDRVAAPCASIPNPRSKSADGVRRLKQRD